MMEGMDPPEHFVETVVEEIGVDPGEEIVTSDNTVLSSGIGMNTVVYSQGPEDGVIMEGDELESELVVGQSLSDKLSEQLQSHHLMQLSRSNHHLMSVGRNTFDLVNLPHQSDYSGKLDSGTEFLYLTEKGGGDLIVGSMIDDHSVVVNTGNLDQPEYVAMKPQSMGEVIIGNQVILHENMGNEMIVEHSVEVGADDDQSHGDIILVPNSMIKQEDIIEGGEVVVGSSVGNEIVIDHIGSNGRFYVGGPSDVGADHIIDTGFDESRLVIDTSSNLKMDDMPIMAYDCVECGAVLKSRASLKKHIKNHHQQHLVMKEKKQHKKLMMQQMQSEQAEMSGGVSHNRLYCCSSCSYTTQRRDKLDKHMQKHVMLEGYHPCGKKRNKPTIPPQRHRHNAEEYRCPMCTYSCTVYKALKKHMKLHTASGKHFVVKISCKICGKDRSTEADLQKHMKKHREGKNFLCDVCGFASIQMKKIIQHRRMHTGEKPHLCPHCNYRSARRDNLRSHVRRMHKKENVYIDTFNPTEDGVPGGENSVE